MNLLYVGNFNPWTDKNDNELDEALNTFDNVIIGVSKIARSPKKGQPTKILMPEIKHRVKIIYYSKLATLLNKYPDYKYIMFER